MGEAVYYMKARFESEEKAAQILEKVDNLCQRIEEASDVWQNTRHKGKEADRQLRIKFPDVFSALHIEEDPIIDGGLNYLAGLLNSPYPDGDIRQEGEYILIYGNVWHFANWDNLALAIQELGAEEVQWLSDEYINPFDLIRI